MVDTSEPREPIYLNDGDAVEPEPQIASSESIDITSVHNATDVLQVDELNGEPTIPDLTVESTEDNIATKKPRTAKEEHLSDLLDAWYGPDGVFKKIITAKKQKNKTTDTDSSIQPNKEAAKRAEPQIVKRGNLLVPASDITTKKLRTKLVRILNIDELNGMAKKGAEEVGFTPCSFVFEKDGSLVINGIVFKNTLRVTRVINEMLFAYRNGLLSLAELYRKCGFDKDDKLDYEIKLGRENIHDLLWHMKKNRIAIYDDEKRSGISFYPMIFEDKR